MLLSIALITLFSLLLSYLFKKIHLPGLIGMLLTGIVLGPYVLDLIDIKILDIASELRQIALVVILIRAGLSLDLSDLKKIGRPAVLLSFIPALFEMMAITLIAPLLFDISTLEAAILGAIVAAVSPAVIVPRMIHLIHKMKGEEKRVPQMVLAGASVDDVFVIVVFSSLISIYQGNSLSVIDFFMIPSSIILGALLGVASGLFLVWFFMKFHTRDTIKVLILFSTGFLFLTLETFIKDFISVSGLIAIMILGITILTKYPVLAKRLVGKFEKIWVIAEIMLFVLVGAVLNLSVLSDIGFYAFILILIALVFRTIGVNIALIKSNLRKEEKLFVSFSYLPKATVQAAIGSIPLAIGIPNGELILAIAVLAILITAPIGAILIDHSEKLLLR